MQIDAWLVALGLSEYVQVFADNAIDYETLCTLTDADLLQLGVAALGHRRKLLAAIASLPSSGMPTTDLERFTHGLHRPASRNQPMMSWGVTCSSASAMAS